MTVEQPTETDTSPTFMRRIRLGVGMLIIVGWSWYWGILSDLGFSDMAINRGRGGLTLLAVGIGGTAIGLRWLKVPGRVRWAIFAIAMLVPALVLFRWFRDLAATPTGT